MKTTKMIALAGLICTFTGFESYAQKDAKKVADKQNEEKFEDTRLEKDVDFTVTAADDGLFEVQAAALAKTNASSAKVKELARHMMADHTKTNVELETVAKKKNITLPVKLSNKNQDRFDKLTKLKGKEFDEEYAKMMVSAHKDAIDLFEKEAEKGKDGELKAWAAGKVATLKHHLEMAQSTEDSLK